MTTPPQEVINAIEAGRSKIIRSVQIYESDAETLWEPEGVVDTSLRLVDGSVTLDYTREERRMLELTLENSDGSLRPNSQGGFWYDKIMKPYRGIEYELAYVDTKVAIVEAIGASNQAAMFKTALGRAGFTNVDIKTSATTVSDVTGYDIIAVFSGNTAMTKYALLQSLYNQGRNILTVGNANGTTQLPFVTTTAAVGSPATWGLNKPVFDGPLNDVSWVNTAEPSTFTGVSITAVSSQARIAAQWTGSTVTALFAVNPTGGRWFDLHLPTVSTAASIAVLKGGMNLARDYAPFKTWNMPLGEFMIDNIAASNFPHQVKITGRDFTKKMKNSKFEHATTFAAGTNITDMIKAIAANAGIAKTHIPNLSSNLPSDIGIDRGTERFKVVKDACDSLGYDIYFDNKGYLTMTEFQDPSFSPVTIDFKTGPDGNLVTYDRSVNDGRIYNHICIYGDPADGEDRLPYFGEAINTDPSSPTSVSKIGDRFFSYASSFFTNDEQCQQLADAWLKIHALESYDINFNALYYPWLEVGSIIGFYDPDRFDYEPTRFLMDTISYPLGLGPMSATGKRVTFVGEN